MMFFIFALFCKITYAFLLNLCSPHSTSDCKYRKKFIHSLFFLWVRVYLSSFWVNLVNDSLL